MNFPQYLELKFVEWQHKVGGRKTIADFATYLGVGQTTVSAYLNGKREPEGDTLRKLSEKLGLDIYDYVDAERPDEDLHYLQTHWNQYSPEERRRIREQAESYAAENKKKKK